MDIVEIPAQNVRAYLQPLLAQLVKVYALCIAINHSSGYKLLLQIIMYGSTCNNYYSYALTMQIQPSTHIMYQRGL